MVAEDCLRLAWEADRDDRRKLRDSVLTLAVVESGPDDAWGDRCRARLVAERPEHYLGRFPNVRSALADLRVLEARERLRSKYPEARVGGLLLMARAARGLYTGRAESIDAMIEDLAGPAAEAENIRRDSAQSTRGPLVVARLRSLTPVHASPADRGGPGWDGTVDSPADAFDHQAGDRPDLDHFYFSVLLAGAVLIATNGPASR